MQSKCKIRIMELAMSKLSRSTFKAINLACGSKLCCKEGWLNADHEPFDTERVVNINLLKTLPFEEGGFDVVYHSQFLEHLSYDQGLDFIKECKRILKPGGVVRIVTPDLEDQAKSYLELLKQLKARPSDKDLVLKYEWIRLEMLDQLNRNQSGGEMTKFLSENGMEIKSYLFDRMGRSGRNLIPENGEIVKFGLMIEAARYLRKLVKVVLSKVIPTELEVGRFRRSGEVHQYMYDEFSLARLLEQAGLVEIRRVSANTSCLQEWNDTLLDVDGDGVPDCGTSLFFEAKKAE